MKIARYMLVIASVILLGLLVNTGCKKGAQLEPADLGDMESPAGEVPGVSLGEPTVGEGAGVAITDVKFVLPSLEEVGVDSKRISRHAKIKVIYEGELESDIELTLDGNPVAHTVLSNENGELLLKPNMPLHNLKEYTILGQSFKVKAPGDINGDGLSDFVVGAPDFDDGNYKGAAYVFFGNPDNAYPSSYQGADVKMYVGTFEAKFG
ncbi:MAG: FG-GAP repeat protein, partial [candidate division Zixibacteria bacterium]|nr:FG-GAP repeat protein [candidate division Zixibacteria bacterium]